MTSEAFCINCARAGTTMHVTVAGELDIATSRELRDCLSNDMADHAEIVVLDLAEVSFIDSSGVHALIEATARFDGRLRVIPNPALIRLLDLMGLHDHLPVVDASSDLRERTGP